METATYGDKLGYITHNDANISTSIVNNVPGVEGGAVIVSKPADMLLSPREYLFIKYYLECYSSSQAAVRAGYSHGNEGNRLMRYPRIRQVVLDAMGNDGITPTEIIARLTRMARVDMSDFFDADESGHPRFNYKKAVEHGVSGLIQEISYDANGMPRVKLYSAKEALDSLAKVHAMFTERVQVNTDTRIDINVNKQVMTAALADPALLAQLGELADAVRASQVPKQLPRSDAPATG